MSRDPVDPIDPLDQPPAPTGPDRPPPGRLRPTSYRLLAGLASVGLVLGWALRPVSLELGSPAPRTGWEQAAALYLVAAILLVLARATRLAVARDRTALDPQQAVNRLVLGRACALVGALALGGYLGIGLSWLGLGEATGERVLRAVVAAGGAGLTLVTGLLVERACRVPGGDEAS